jgi:Ulp1 family protease
VFLILLFSNNHWSVVLIRNWGNNVGTGTKQNKPTLLYFDSLSVLLGENIKEIINNLIEYFNKLKSINSTGPTEKFLIYNPSCPRQSNFSDCGVFLLHFIEWFLQNPEALRLWVK